MGRRGIVSSQFNAKATPNLIPSNLPLSSRKAIVVRLRFLRLAIAVEEKGLYPTDPVTTLDLQNPSQEAPGLHKN